MDIIDIIYRYEFQIGQVHTENVDVTINQQRNNDIYTDGEKKKNFF